jgi:hypothetical protein
VLPTATGTKQVSVIKAAPLSHCGHPALDYRTDFILLRPAGFSAEQGAKLLSKFLKLPDLVVNVTKVSPRNFLHVHTGLLPACRYVEEWFYFLKGYSQRLRSAYKPQ